ncbi:MAG: hypothetical protein ACD_4C00189G0001, partial [uncultured bacterium (gcode 4)]
MEEKIVEIKNCRLCSASFNITNLDLQFYDKVSPVFGWVKYPIPSPTLCPDCRQQRRLSFRNERNLYKRKCDLTQKDIISIYSPDKPYKVYGQSEWWSDKWNPLDYHKDFDFGRWFFEQINELDLIVPKLSIINDEWKWSMNCAYTNDFANWKDCYYCFETWDIENAHYCHHCNWTNNLVDCDEVFLNSSFSYECIDSIWLFNCFYLSNSKDSANCYLWDNLINCKYCVWCSWLNNKEYYILNKKASKEECENLVNNLKSDFKLCESFKIEYLKYRKIIPNKFWNINNSENSFWNGLSNCKNTFGYNIINSNNCRYCINSDSLIDCYDLQCWKSELCYEWLTPDNWYKVLFACWSWKCSNVLYSNDCHSSSNLFWCIWLRNSQYCIL